MEGLCRKLATVMLLLTVSCQAEIYYHDANGEMLQDDPYAPDTYLAGDPYLADWNQDWALRSGRLIQPKCVDIPGNMSLCRNIGYTQMRLPNLLDHDTLREVTQQASSWNPLLGIQCHPDTQLFLCSLFSPVCLDRPIWPCRSLCESVKNSCQGYLQKYGFPWPEMLRCDKFPLDNDLCIGLQNEAKPDDRICEPCNKPSTFETFVDSYCSSDFAVKLRIRENVISDGMTRITSRKKTDPYKAGSLTSAEQEQLTVYIENGAQCECPELERAEATDKFIVMGRRDADKLIATYITVFDKDSNIQKRARRALRNDNLCTDGPLIIPELDDLAATPVQNPDGGRDGQPEVDLDEVNPAPTPAPTEAGRDDINSGRDHVGPQEITPSPSNGVCAPCQGTDTFDNFMERYCASEFTVKVKVRETLVAEGAKVVRAKDRARTYNIGTLDRRDLYDMSIYVEDGARCECPVLDSPSTKQIIVMGRRTDNRNIATFIQAFDKNSKEQRRSLRAVRRSNVCPEQGTSGLPGTHANGASNGARPLPATNANSASESNRRQRKNRRNRNRDNDNRRNRNRDEQREDRRRMRGRERKNPRERKRRRQERQRANSEGVLN